MGDVVTGKYDFSINSWHMSPKRSEVLDLIPVHTAYIIHALKKSANKIDSGLFLRPVQTHVWFAVFSTILLLILSNFIPWLFFKNKFMESWSHKISYLTAWYFFVLFNAYYSGMLTMFFTTEFQSQFEGTRDVLRAYPEWKMVTKQGLPMIHPILFDIRQNYPV